MPEITSQEPNEIDPLPQRVTARKRRTGKSGVLTKRRFSAEDFFLALIIVASLGASVALALPLKAPPVVVSTFLAIAVSTLVYRFLGGIPAETTVILKTVQVSGSLAALIGLIILFNSTLENWIGREKHMGAMLSLEELSGTWVQMYPEKNWRAEYTFTKSGEDSVNVTGAVRRVTDSTAVDILQVTDGQGKITPNGVDLNLILRGTDGYGFAGRILRWRTTVPLQRQRATRAILDVAFIDPKGNAYSDQRWGFALAKME